MLIDSLDTTSDASMIGATALFVGDGLDPLLNPYYFTLGTAIKDDLATSSIFNIGEDLHDETALKTKRKESEAAVPRPEEPANRPTDACSGTSPVFLPGDGPKNKRTCE